MQADLHGRGAAHLREGPRPHRHDAGQPRAARRRRSSTQAFAVGKKVDALQRDGQVRSRCRSRLQHALFDRLVFSKVRDALRWPGALLHLRRRRAQPRHRRVVPRRRHPDPRGLRPDRDRRPARSSTTPTTTRSAPSARSSPAAEVRLGEDDEIQITGPGVMDGYHNLPDETAKTLTEDGWLRTGDKGALDADGFLTITGRIKELFKTSGGKYIAPPAIEAQVQGASAPTPASSWSSATSATTASRWSPSTPTRSPTGPRRTASPASTTPRSSADPKTREMVAGLRRRAQRPAQPLGDDQEVRAARPRPHRRVRRADPVDEGQAQRRRGQLRRPDRQAVRLIARCQAPSSLTRRRGDPALSASTCTCRSARCAAATATSTPTPPPSSGAAGRRRRTPGTPSPRSRIGRAALGPDRPPVETVFFGGGTPTLLPADDLIRILARDRRPSSASRPGPR